MNRGVAAGLAVACVVANFGAYAVLRDYLSTARSPEPAWTTPSGDESAPADPVNPLQGSVFLKGRPDGAVLRLSPGDCGTEGNQDDPRQLPVAWISPAGAAPVVVEIDGLTQTLATGLTADGWWVVGTDTDCKVTAWTAAGPDGTTWSRSAVPARAWYLDPVDPRLVHAAGGRAVKVGAECDAESVHPAADRYYVVCTDDRLLQASLDSDLIESGVDTGVTAAAVGPDGLVAVLYNTPTCRARLEVLDEGKPVESRQECFGNDRFALGVTWIGEDLAAQSGYALRDDSSGTWVDRG